MRVFRLLKIANVASRYGLDEMVLEQVPEEKPSSTLDARLLKGSS
jgi:hypothetical protein